MNNMMKFLNIHRLMNQDTGTGNGGQTGAAEPKNELQNTEPDNNDSNIKTFTQEEVNEIVAKRLGKERAKIEKERKDRITHYATMKFDSVEEYKAWCKRLNIPTDLPD